MASGFSVLFRILCSAYPGARSGTFSATCELLDIVDRAKLLKDVGAPYPVIRVLDDDDEEGESESDSDCGGSGSDDEDDDADKQTLLSVKDGVHPHPLYLKTHGGGWSCDGCGEDMPSHQRYRCSERCDFDLCKSCFEAGKSEDGEGAPPSTPKKEVAAAKTPQKSTPKKSSDVAVGDRVKVVGGKYDGKEGVVERVSPQKVKLDCTTGMIYKAQVEAA